MTAAASRRNPGTRPSWEGCSSRFEAGATVRQSSPRAPGTSGPPAFVEPVARVPPVRCSVPAAAASSRASSGMLLHRKNESRGRQLEIGDPECVPGARAFRVLLDAEHEPRIGQYRVQRSLDAGVEAVLGTPGAVEREQRIDVGVVHGLPVCAARERLENPSSARELGPGVVAPFVRRRGRRAGRMADEDAAAGSACRPARSG